MHKAAPELSLLKKLEEERQRINPVARRRSSFTVRASEDNADPMQRDSFDNTLSKRISRNLGIGFSATSVHILANATIKEKQDL